MSRGSQLVLFQSNLHIFWHHIWKSEQQFKMATARQMVKNIMKYSYFCGFLDEFLLNKFIQNIFGVLEMQSYNLIALVEDVRKSMTSSSIFVSLASKRGYRVEFCTIFQTNVQSYIMSSENIFKNLHWPATKRAISCCLSIICHDRSLHLDFELLLVQP